LLKINNMRFWVVLIWILVIIAVAVPIFLYGAFGRPWLSFNWDAVIENSSISGIVLRDQIWRGDINVTGDVYLAWWAELTIEPGAKVVVANEDDQIAGQKPSLNPDDIAANDPVNSTAYTRSHIEIRGRVQALGEAENPIVFTVLEPAEEYAAWQGLSLRDGSQLSNVKIDNVLTGIKTQADIYLDNISVERCLWNCIYIGKGSANINNSQFALAWHQAALVASDASPLFRECEFSRSAIGLKTVQLSAPVVIKSRFIDNVVAVFMETAGEAKLEGNSLESPAGPQVPGGIFGGDIIYPNNWEPGAGEEIEGIDLVTQNSLK